MEEKNLTQNESLELISKMIRETRNNLERGGGNIFLLWGYVWFFVSIAIYFLLLKTGDSRFHLLWFAIPAIGYPGMFFLLKRRNKGAVTFVGRVITNVWIVIGIVCMLLSIYTFIDHKSYPILFVISLLINSGVAISGQIIKFRPITIAGYVGIILSFTMLMVPGLNQLLIYAFFAVIILIVPGHFLNLACRRAKGNNNS